MSKPLKDCSVELVKIAREKTREQGYGRAMVASLPMAATMAAADIPKGMLEKSVEQRVKKTPKTKSTTSLRRGIGRGTGRLAAGTLTTPMFLSGIKDIREGKTKEEKRRGYAKIVGSGATFATTKGGIEAGIEHGLKDPKVLKKMKSVASVRGLMGVGAGLVTAKSIADATKPSKKGEKSKAKELVLPAAVGAGTGLAEGAVEEAWGRKFKGLKKPEAIKAMKAKALGRGAAGVLGAVALSKLTNTMLEKKSAEQMNLGPKPGELYDQVRDWSAKQPDEILQRQVTALSINEPEKTPTRRAVFYAFSDEMKDRGMEAPSQPMRPKTHGQVKATPGVDAAVAAAVLAAPYAVWGLAKTHMTAGRKDQVMLDALDRMVAARGIERMEAGIDFFGRLRFDQPVQSFYLRAGGETDLGRETLKAHRDASPQVRARARRFASAYQGGQREYISAPRNVNPAVLAHELGHASAGELRRKTIGSATSSKAFAMAKVPALLLPLLALDGASDSSFTTREDLEARAQFSETVGKVALALSAPLLTEEALASAKGLEYLTRVGDTPTAALRRGVRVLAPAFATYAAPAATPFAIAAYLRRKAES